MAVGIVIDDKTVQGGVGQTNPLPVVIKTGTTGTNTSIATETTLLKLVGIGIPEWDYTNLTQAATTDTWVFKTGGAGGTTVATVVITYTDTTKATISNVTKT